MSFLAAKSALENASDEKRKIEINSQFKKARARLICIKTEFLIFSKISSDKKLAPISYIDC